MADGAVGCLEQPCLVADTVDGRQMKRSCYWPKSHDQVVQARLGKARKGSRAICLPGNHGAALRPSIAVRFAAEGAKQDVVHLTAGGRRQERLGHRYN